MPRLDRVSLAATDGDVPSTSAAPPVLWCGRITMQFSGRCEGSSFLRGAVAEPHSTWLAPRIIFRPDKKSAAGAYPRRGRREEGSAAYVVRIRKVQLGVVMVAEGNDAGMRRRVRRDQNDREEKVARAGARNIAI